MGCPALHIDTLFSDYTPKLEVVHKRTTPKKVFKYYPYGMLMPGRFGEVANSSYTYGFQGQEKDNEIKGKGNSYTTQFRSYDPRLGRWLSLDPLSGNFPWQSPYAAFDNNPVLLTDPSGLAAGGPGDPEKRKLNKGINGGQGSANKAGTGGKVNDRVVIYADVSMTDGNTNSPSLAFPSLIADLHDISLTELYLYNPGLAENRHVIGQGQMLYVEGSPIPESFNKYLLNLGEKYGKPISTVENKNVTFHIGDVFRFETKVSVDVGIKGVKGLSIGLAKINVGLGYGVQTGSWDRGWAGSYQFSTSTGVGGTATFFKKMKYTIALEQELSGETASDILDEISGSEFTYGAIIFGGHLSLSNSHGVVFSGAGKGSGLGSGIGESNVKLKGLKPLKPKSLLDSMGIYYFSGDTTLKGINSFKKRHGL